MRNSARSTNAQPREWPTLRVTVVLSLILASGTIVNLPARALPSPLPSSPLGSPGSVLDRDLPAGRVPSSLLPGAPWAGDSLRSLLVHQLEDAHRFLLSRRHGLPYTRDPRSLRPFSEVIRLQADAQALGYLDLFAVTGKPMYRDQAEQRLDYILALGDSALSGGPLDGQVGYSLLRAYEITGRHEYLEAGLRIARRCQTRLDDVMNGGYAAALVCGRAFRLTGDSTFLWTCRKTTRRTAAFQFPDGAFPHRDSKLLGENAPYTAWMVFEMLLHARDDPANPDVPVAVLRATRFLGRRVNPDGTLNYADSLGSYASDPGNADPRGWVSEIPIVAFDLLAVGERTKSLRLLGFLLQSELVHDDRGSYPDKWGYPDPADPWASGRPSILRTSLVFWVLSMIAATPNRPENGLRRRCVVTPDDCAAPFRELDQCDSPRAGFDVCIDGNRTGCMDESLIRYRENEGCRWTSLCVYDPFTDVSEWTECLGTAADLCIADACSDACRDIRADDPACEHRLVPGDVCRTRSGVAPARAVHPDPTPALPRGLAISAVRPNPGTGSFSIDFVLPERGEVTLELFDIAGRRVMVRRLGELLAGMHTLRPPVGAALPCGTYFFVLRQARERATARLVVVP
jgi:hypothetical protein